MNKFKYHRIFHVPWSDGLTSDDRKIKSLDNFIGKEVVVTLKIDGECTSLYSDCIHARSLDSKNHPSRNWIKNLHAQIKHLIPEDLKIVGENCFASHSIKYQFLSTYFYVFGIFNDKECLSWDETVEYAKLLDLETVPVLYHGIWDEEKIKACFTEKVNNDEQEGYVIRLASSYLIEDSENSICKWVRKNHITCSEHWMSERIIPNKLSDKLSQSMT